MNRHGPEQTLIEFAVDEVAEADGYVGVSKLEEAEERRAARVYMERHRPQLGNRTHLLLSGSTEDWDNYERWRFPKGRRHHEEEKARALLREKHRTEMYVGAGGGCWAACDPVVRSKWLDRMEDRAAPPDLYHNFDPSGHPMPPAITVGGPREYDGALRYHRFLDILRSKICFSLLGTMSR